jgi:hypothetical protein
LLQVVDVFGSAAGQLVSLKVCESDHRHANSIEFSEHRRGPAVFDGDAVNFIHDFDADRGNSATSGAR